MPNQPIPFPTNRAAEVQQQVRAMYGRVLSTWAMDLLRLRSKGLQTPSARAGDANLVFPVGMAGVGASIAGVWSRGVDVSQQLRWSPERSAA